VKNVAKIMPLKKKSIMLDNYPCKGDKQKMPKLLASLNLFLSSPVTPPKTQFG
jgi:hypothetical protein